MPTDRNDWTTRDRWNKLVVSLLTPVVGILGACLLAVTVFTVQWQFAAAKEGLSKVNDKAELASKKSEDVDKRAAVLEEAVSTIKGSIEKIEKGNEKVNDKLDRLIEMNRRLQR